MVVRPLERCRVCSLGDCDSGPLCGVGRIAGLTRQTHRRREVVDQLVELDARPVGPTGVIVRFSFLELGVEFADSFFVLLASLGVDQLAGAGLAYARSCEVENVNLAAGLVQEFGDVLEAFCCPEQRCASRKS